MDHQQAVLLTYISISFYLVSRNLNPASHYYQHITGRTLSNQWSQHNSTAGCDTRSLNKV